MTKVWHGVKDKIERERQNGRNCTEYIPQYYQNTSAGVSTTLSHGLHWFFGRERVQVI